MRCSHSLAGLVALIIFSRAGAAPAAEPTKVVDDKTKIAVKVIVTNKGGTDLLAEPGGVKAGALGEMEIAFVFSDDGKPTREANGKQWYRVGRDDDDEPEGWVAADAVQEWRTRSALTPNDNLVPGKRVFVVKRTDGKKDAKGDVDIVYDGHAPANYQFLAPILVPRENDDEPYKVFVYGATTQGTIGAATSGKPAESTAFADANLEVVFVIDTTASMTPLIEGVKRVVSTIARHLGEAKDGNALAQRVRFGLVEYQDSTPGLTPARVKVKLTDAQAFEQQIQGVRVATIGSDEWSEDVVAGLLMAVDRKKDGSFGDAVGWSGNSSKHIILCGDASALPKDDPKSSTHLGIGDILQKALPKDIAEDAARARAEIICHAIFAKNENGRGDWEQATADFTQAAENMGKLQGVNKEMEVGNSDSEKSVVDEVVKVLNTSITVLAGGAVSAAELKESPIAQAVYRLRDGTPLDGVALGTAKELNEDDQVVALETWFIKYQEMQQLKSTLTFLRERFEQMTPKQRASSDKILDSLRVAFASAGIGEPKVTMKLSECLPGLPLHNPLLDLTIEDLATKSDAAFKEWLNGLQTAERVCEELLNIKQGGSGVNAWMKMGRVVVTFVPVERLP